MTDADGGEGGSFGLEIRYSRGEGGTSRYELEVNGQVQKNLEFESTGSFSMREARILQTTVRLMPGQNNVICLRKIDGEDRGIFVDSFAVVPYPGCFVEKILL